MRPEPTIRPVAAGDAQALSALFDAADSPCACRYLHFGGDKNEWLMRCASPERENHTELHAALASGSPEALGVVAAIDGAIVAWLKVAPAQSVPKALEQRTYRALPVFAGDRAGLYLLGCALIHPAERKRGLVAPLLDGAIALARDHGARALVALPRVPREPVSDAELWSLPFGPLARAGFVAVDGELPYPVLRLELGA